MDKTAYLQNRRKQPAGNGKFLYYYPYTPCAADATKICRLAGKTYVKTEVTEAEWEALIAADREEYNNDRRYGNAHRRQDPLRLFDKESGEERDFWSEIAADEETRHIEADVCERMDEKAALGRLSAKDGRIYALDRAGYTQAEIARILRRNQSTISRRLKEIHRYTNICRFDDGSRSKKELAFEADWQEFLCTRRMPDDEDCKIVLFCLLIDETLLGDLYRWYCSPKEFLRCALRFLTLNASESTDELFRSLCDRHQAYYRASGFDKQPEWLRRLFLQILKELERRMATMPEPTGNLFRGMEREIEKAARRRNLDRDFYLDEILYRKYLIRRLSRTLDYIRRICAKAKDGEMKAALKKEISTLLGRRKKLREELSALTSRSPE